MRTPIFRRVLISIFVLLVAGAAPAAHAQAPVVKETLTAGMPYGEAVFPLRHPNRLPNPFFHPVLYFTDQAGATKAETQRVDRFGGEGAWTVLVDLKKLQAGLKDEAQFAASVNALASAVKENMSASLGPRLKGMPERVWPMTFAGSGTGAVRAVEAAIQYKAYGGVRGVLLISPADQAPSLDKDGEPLLLNALFPKLGVTPVAFIAPAENARLHALSEKTIGFTSLKKTVSEGLSFVSMYYPIRHRRDPRKAPPAQNPANLFRPGR